jgi:uncharacterized RDD family membrane protein YckC
LALASRVKLLIVIVTFVEGIAGAFMLTGLVLIWIGYFIFCEIRMNGLTPGKRIMAIRVMNEHGYPVTAVAVVLRNLLRVFDFLPFGYGVGVLSIFVTGNYQRLGDLIGGTIVVKQRSPDRLRSLDNLLRAARITPEHLDKQALQLVMRDAGTLSPEEYLAVKHFTERRRSLDWNAQQIAAMKIAVPMMERLNIIPPSGVSSVNYADFLEYLSVAYELNRRPK